MSGFVRTVFAASALVLVGCTDTLTAGVSRAEAQEPAQVTDLPNVSDAFTTSPFGFEYEGVRFEGLIDQPVSGDPDGLVVIIYGSGRTNVASGESLVSVREMFANHNLAVFAYDKAGNGNSGGTHNGDQPVADSALEALAGINALRDQQVPGSDRIGMWGLSRAGWIIPLILQDDDDIAFWVSVSAPGPLSNMEYLFTANWQLRGYDQTQIDLLLSEWKEGFAITARGGSWDEYLAATPNLLEDPLVTQVRGQYNEDRFVSYRDFLAENPPVIDPDTGLMVFVEDFDTVLSSVRTPVLAILGERDTQVDWRATQTLYERTIGQSNPLTTATLPDCNHFMLICEDCGFGDRLEPVNRPDTGNVCPGFYDETSAFLTDLGFPKLEDQ